MVADVVRGVGTTAVVVRALLGIVVEALRRLVVRIIGFDEIVAALALVAIPVAAGRCEGLEVVLVTLEPVVPGREVTRLLRLDIDVVDAARP